MMGALLLALLASNAFTKVSDEGGVLLESREVPGSAWLEYRASATAPGNVEALCARAYGTSGIDAGEPHLVSRRVLFEAPDERVTWDRISPPMVSGRDYVVRRTRTRGADGSCRVEFHADPSLAPPEVSGWVRITVLRGSFVFEPLPGGLVRITHQVHMDPGGLITPVLAESTRRRMAVAWVRRLQEPAR